MLISGKGMYRARYPEKKQLSHSAVLAVKRWKTFRVMQRQNSQIIGSKTQQIKMKILSEGCQVLHDGLLQELPS